MLTRRRTFEREKVARDANLFLSEMPNLKQELFDVFLEHPVNTAWSRCGPHRVGARASKIIPSKPSNTFLIES